MSGGVKSGAAVPLAREAPVRVIKNLSPGVAFASVCGIIIGAMMLLGAAGQLVVAYIKLDHFQPAYRADAALAVWRWLSIALLACCGLGALLGGIDGVGGRPRAARTLKRVACATIAWWVVEAYFWGTWSFLRVTEGRVTVYGFATANEHVPSVLAWLIVSALCIFSWVVVTFVFLRERRQSPLAQEASEDDELLRPVISQPPFIDYGSQADARRSSFQAPSTLVRLLFVLAIVQGVASLCMDREALLRASFNGSSSALLASRQLLQAAMQRDTWFLLTGVLDGGAAMVVILGGIWGLARSLTGRNLLCTGLGIMLILAIVQLWLQLTGVVSEVVGPYGHQSWFTIAYPIGSFIRLQLFTIICFVALARKSPSDAGGEIGR